MNPLIPPIPPCGSTLMKPAGTPPSYPMGNIHGTGYRMRKSSMLALTTSVLQESTRIPFGCICVGVRAHHLPVQGLCLNRYAVMPLALFMSTLSWTCYSAYGVEANIQLRTV